MEQKIANLGVMVDCSRDAVYSTQTLKNFMDVISDMGYNVLQLYTEDTFEIEDPYFGYLRGKYSAQELKELDSYAKSKNIELVPCIQTLAHLMGYLRWNGDVVDCNDILLIDEPKTYELIDKMFASCAKCFTSRRINIGMDEAHMVGLGKYLDQHGYKNRFDIILSHLNKVVDIAQKYGFKPMMWSDMFFRLANCGQYYVTNSTISKDVIDLVPKNLELVYWDYYSLNKDHYDKMISAHKNFNNNIVFAGGAWSWSGFAPNNTFSIKANELAIKSCIEHNVSDVLMTVWKDDGAECSLFSVIPSLFHASQMAKGIYDVEQIKSNFFKSFGISFDDFTFLDEPNLIDETNDIINPCKYMLYSDPFLGIYDYTVDVSKAERFKTVYEKLNKIDGGKYNYVFKTLASLCEVLEYKYTLGVDTREAYKNNDKTRLKELIERYSIIEDKVEVFYNNFKNQWFLESKTYGFEKHDIRIGGLLRRLKSCKERLEDYLNGKIDRILELEEEILQPRKDVAKGKATCDNTWLYVAMMKPNF